MTPSTDPSERDYQYRIGRVVGTVWFSESDNGRGRHSVQIWRLYRTNDEDGWKRSMSFHCDDLPLVAKVADHRHTWIHEIRRKQRYYSACSQCTAKWSATSWLLVACFDRILPSFEHYPSPLHLP